MRYKAKIDWWIAAFIIVAIIVPWFTRAQWTSCAILAVMVVFGHPQWFETRETELLVRAGLTRRTIPYTKIRAACATDEGRGGLALSLDRVRITYDFSSQLLIAPLDRQAFLADLATRCPHLVQRGTELVERVI